MKTKAIEVVYADGVFKPQEPVELEEGEELRIKIEEIMDKGKKARVILDKHKKFTPVRLKPDELEEIYLGTNRY